MVGDEEASHVDLISKEGFSLALSEAEPEASLRATKSFIWEVVEKTPVGEGWSETWREKQPKQGCDIKFVTSVGTCSFILLGLLKTYRMFTSEFSHLQGEGSTDMWVP